LLSSEFSVWKGLTKVNFFDIILIEIDFQFLFTD